MENAKSGRIAEEVARMMRRIETILAVAHLQATDESWLADGNGERFRRALEAQKTDLEWVRKQHEASTT